MRLRRRDVGSRPVAVLVAVVLVLASLVISTGRAVFDLLGAAPQELAQAGVAFSGAQQASVLAFILGMAVGLLLLRSTAGGPGRGSGYCC